jgi:hypothetical protein
MRLPVLTKQCPKLCKKPQTNNNNKNKQTKTNKKQKMCYLEDDVGAALAVTAVTHYGEDDLLVVVQNFVLRNPTRPPETQNKIY